MGYVRDRLGDAWSIYLATGQGPAGGTVTSPDGAVVHFDSTGSYDYSTAPPVTASTVEQDPNSPFYGWTEEQKDAYDAGLGVTGIATDAVKAAAVILPGETVPTVDAALVAASDAKLRALAASDPKVAAAIAQAQSGTFRGAQQATYDATNAADLQADVATMLQSWLEVRQDFIDDHEPGAADLPLMPPSTFTGPLNADAIVALQKLVAQLPPAPPPPTSPPQTTTAVVRTTTLAPTNNVPSSSNPSSPASTQTLPTTGGAGAVDDTSGGGIPLTALAIGGIALGAFFLLRKR